MIRLFDRNETNFNHNQNVISPLSCFVDEEANGMFEVECDVDKSVSMDKGDIIKAPTPRGEQLFRIYHINRTLKGKKVYGKHIFYDLVDNFILNLNLNNVTGVSAINSVLSGTEYQHNYTVTSDVLTLGSTKFTRINPVRAILGTDGIVNTWGGNIIRNGYTIQYKTNGIDRGYEVRMGKNLVGIEDDSDESEVKTRIYPYAELGNDVTVTLPEKYIDSPLLANYGNPKIDSVKVELTDDQKSLSEAEICTIMRKYCNDLYSVSNIDKPVINYKINFVELSKTEQYKDLAILEQLDLYDIVTCNISQLNINVKAKVIKYKYNCLKDRFENIELGDFKASSSYQTDNIIKQISERFKATETAIDHATNVITGNKGGYLITRRYPNGKPYEILIMDTEDINTAKDVLRINKDGIGFSRTGYNGPFPIAMTIDGHMVADFMDTGTLTAILLKSSNYATDSQGNLIQGSRFNLANGLLETVNCILNGKITSMDGDIGGWKIGSDGLTSNNALASINIYNQNNKAMKLSYGGLHLFNHYSGASEYLGSMLTTYNQEDQSNGICLTQSGNAEYLGIGYTEATSPSAGDQISFGMVYSHNGGSVQGTPIIAGFNFFKDIDLGYNFITNCGRINGGIPITSENKNDYTYPIAQHYHNIYEINNLNLTLQEFDGRIRALENA